MCHTVAFLSSTRPCPRSTEEASLSSRNARAVQGCSTTWTGHHHNGYYPGFTSMSSASRTMALSHRTQPPAMRSGLWTLRSCSACSKDIPHLALCRFPHTSGSYHAGIWATVSSSLDGIEKAGCFAFTLNADYEYILYISVSITVIDLP